MAVEVAESNLPFTVGAGEEAKVDNGNITIKFGSHGVDEPIKQEETKVSDSNVPTDVVDEWPEPQKIHSFYIIRYRALEDQNVKAKLEMADKEVSKLNDARRKLIEKLKIKRTDRSQLITQLRSLIGESKQYRSIMDEKRKEMEPLHQALGMWKGTSGGRDRGSGICSSEQELNNLIKSYQYRIQHESIPLNEEKQILREIKQLEATRPKVIANAAERAKVQELLGEKEAIQGQVKSIGVDMDVVRKDKQAVSAKLKQLDEEKLAIEKVISALEEELTALTQKREQTYENIKNLWKQRDEGNSPFYENRTLWKKANILAVNKDVDALKELLDTEAEKFMSQWNSNKALRKDYEKRILQSLDTRQLSKDGRVRNPGEKPLVQLEKPIPSQSEPVKAIAKQTPKGDLVSPVQVDADSSEQKVQKPKSAKNPKDANMTPEIALEKVDPAEEEEEVFSTYNLQKGSLPKRNEVDEAKLKEQKREEEIAKRNQAEERKKKQAEKAAAKAAIKAQKEAEKKLKEREKKARKKSGAAVPSVDSDEQAEAVAEVAEEEKIEEKVETVVPQKKKDRKEITTRQRGRPRGSDSLPKAVLKRKKATNYWMWAAPAAFVMLILLVVGFYYLM